MLELVSVVFCCWQHAQPTVSPALSLPRSTGFLIYHHSQDHYACHYRSFNSAVLFLGHLSTHCCTIYVDVISYECGVVYPTIVTHYVYVTSYECWSSVYIQLRLLVPQVRFNRCPSLNSRTIFIDTRYWLHDSIHWYSLHHCLLSQYFDVVV